MHRSPLTSRLFPGAHRRAMLIFASAILALSACQDDPGAPGSTTPPDVILYDEDMSSAPDLGDAPDQAADMTPDLAPDMMVEPGVDRTAQYFELDRVLQVDIQLDEADWDSLRGETRMLADILAGDCLKNPPADVFNWYSARVTVDGERLDDVGIRKKGFLGSLSTTKPSLKIKFDKFVEDQLLGDALERLTLNNVQQDDSKLNTCMAYHAFNAAGIPAPRCNFARVAINGEDYGLFAHVESIRSDLLSRHFEDTGGELFEGSLSDFRPVWRGTFESKYEDRAEGDTIGEVVAALQAAEAGDFDPLASVVDLDAFLSFWAMEVIVAHWDGYAGNRNNFYFYRPPGEKIRFIPWGADATFTPLDHPFTPEDDPESVMAQGAIAYWLYKNPTRRTAYIARLKQLLETSWDEQEMLALVDRMEAIVMANLVVSDPARVEAGITRVRSFVINRRAEILDELSSGPVEWTLPLPAPDLCWEELGQVDVSFETTWGTLGDAEPFGKGSLTIHSYNIEGEALSFNAVGATAGYNEDTQPGEDPGAVISLLGLDAANVVHAINVYAAPDRIHGGSEITLDQATADAFRILVLPPTYQDVDVPGRFSKGKIVLEIASLVPGAPIKGRLTANYYNFGGYVSGSNEPAPDESGLIINEINARGEPLDWFEVRNTSEVPLELSDFVVADDLTDESKRRAMPAYTLMPGEYLMIEVDTDNWAGFKLGKDEELGIWNAEGALVDAIDWADGDSPDGGSYARSPDSTGDFQASATPSPGEPNR